MTLERSLTLCTFPRVHSPISSSLDSIGTRKRDTCSALHSLQVFRRFRTPLRPLGLLRHLRFDTEVLTLVRPVEEARDVRRSSVHTLCVQADFLSVVHYLGTSIVRTLAHQARTNTSTATGQTIRSLPFCSALSVICLSRLFIFPYLIRSTDRPTAAVGSSRVAKYAFAAAND